MGLSGKRAKISFKRNVFLRDHTTFKIGGPAEYFFEAKSREDLALAIKTAVNLKLPFFILGGGSNVLVSDKGLRGLVIKLAAKKCRVEGLRVIVESGMGLKELAGILVKAGLSGLEWSAGIPGTVGGAVRGNAGAFGWEMKDAVKSVEVLEIPGKKDGFKTKFRKVSGGGCRFGYRTSLFKENPRLIVVSVEFQLERESEEKVKKNIQECLDYRKEHHPQGFSAGSIFKGLKVKDVSPVFLKRFPQFKEFIKDGILPAAPLIAEAGLVGRKIGGAGISKKHANFIVNSGQASAADVIKIMNFVKMRVRNKFGVVLEEEIQYLGF